jgi:hypothetical protein
MSPLLRNGVLYISAGGEKNRNTNYKATHINEDLD